MSYGMGSGILAALGAAALFGASTPLAKLLLEQTSPWLLAALFYLGSGVGLWLMRRIRRMPNSHLLPCEGRWLAAATIAGGIVAPVLLMWGLVRMPASGAALLLNAEGVFTALLAWFVFKENFDHRVALGMLAIVAGALVLAWPVEGAVELASIGPMLAVLGACLAWGFDNNFTRKVALNDASWITMVKGLVAGTTNLVIALGLGAHLPAPSQLFAAALVGFLSYGASLTLFVIGLRHLGTARTGAYFSVAPFFGAALALLVLNESVTPQLLIACVLMVIGVLMHITERHAHAHSHEPLAHEHEHVHSANDRHHEHAHGSIAPAGTKHSHMHEHTPLTHMHPHFPDAHHQHKH